MRPGFTAAIFLTLLLSSSPGLAEYRLEFNDRPDGAGTCFIPEVGLQEVSTFYIIARPRTSGDVFQGAEFSVRGFPAIGYAIQATPSPQATLVLGDPFTAGVNIGFDTCHEGVVVLYTVEITKLQEDAEPVTGSIDRHYFPSDPDFQWCPVVIGCEPLYTSQCDIGPGRTSIGGPVVGNASQPDPADGATDVPLTADLSAQIEGPFWEPCCVADGIPHVRVYFGTEVDPPLAETFEYAWALASYEPGMLMPFTTYHWRISWYRGLCGFGTGPLWSFTTGETVGVESTTWHAVKLLYR
jgi:hypothetical protein